MLFEEILDGRNRYRACLEGGIEPRFELFYGDNDKALSYVISLNLKRRHLDESQCGMIAARIATISKGANQHSEGLPIGRASELLNVSERSAHRARQILEHGVPELVKDVDHGAVAVSAAADVLRLPEPKQREIVSAGTKSITAAVRVIRSPKGDNAPKATTAEPPPKSIKLRAIIPSSDIVGRQLLILNHRSYRERCSM